MKLYVWEYVLVDYTPGIMFAIAQSEDEARKEILKKCDYIPEEDLAKTPDVYDITTPVGFYCWGGA
jgi:hypothetical protein